MIVDDHTPSSERASAGCLCDTECKVIGACASVAEALKIVAGEKIDLVLLDYDLGENPGTHLDESKRCGFAGPVLQTGGMAVARPGQRRFRCLSQEQPISGVVKKQFAAS